MAAAGTFRMNRRNGSGNGCNRAVATCTCTAVTAGKPAGGALKGVPLFYFKAGGSYDPSVQGEVADMGRRCFVN